MQFFFNHNADLLGMFYCLSVNNYYKVHYDHVKNVKCMIMLMYRTFRVYMTSKHNMHCPFYMSSSIGHTESKGHIDTTVINITRSIQKYK